MFVRIPTARVAVLIGHEGATKRLIEHKSRTRITVDDNLVDISGEALAELAAVEVVKAIGRGFSPEKALQLLDENYQLVVLTLSLTPNSMKRIAGRVIGKNGRARERLEEFTLSSISVFGKTVSIIAKHENARIAEDAVEMLIHGRSHKYVYAMIEKRARKKLA